MCYFGSFFLSRACSKNKSSKNKSHWIRFWWTTGVWKLLESNLNKIKVVLGPFASLTLQMMLGSGLLALGGGSGCITRGLLVSINCACRAPISAASNSMLISPQGSRPPPQPAKKGSLKCWPTPPTLGMSMQPRPGQLEQWDLLASEISPES